MYPIITNEPAGQDCYDRSRQCGHSHDQAFSWAAWRVAHQRKPKYDDGDTINFIRVDPREHKVTSNFEDQVRFWTMVISGQSFKMAEVLATRSFPGVKSDAVFNEGKFSGDDGRVGAEQTWLRGRAESAGVSTNGKWYCRGLASFPGDPTAWVGDRGDVLRIAREKNLTVHGYVEHQGHATDPGGDIPVADDIVADAAQAILDEHPFTAPEEAHARAFALRSGAVDDNPLRVRDYTEADLREFA